jgi:ParB family chromosome partitioning protein
MNLQTVPLSSLAPGRSNPRKAMDRKAIEGLAASIRTDGLLQNLVVSPVKGKGRRKHYEVVSGERRLRALRLLHERGELAKDYAVPVEIRTGLSKDETLRIATVENVQRQNLTPLEETAALTKLVHKGTTLDDVAAQTGLSHRTIKRRLALNGLCSEAKKALAAGAIALSQAEALTLGSDDMQHGILGDIGRGSEFSADQIRAALLDERPTLALAIFPVEQYTGSITTDLFAEKETSYFDDPEQFLILQNAAVSELAKHHEASAAWVEVTNAYHIPEWQYRKAGKREKGGVLINVSPAGKVEIREGLVKRPIDKQTAAETMDHPAAPPKRKAAYSAALCGYIGYHKTAVVQALLLGSQRKAKEVAVVERLLRFRPHQAFAALANEAEPQSAFTILSEHVKEFALMLGLPVAEGEEAGQNFPAASADELTLYSAVKRLHYYELEALETLLVALTFGQRDCQRLDTADSLFNSVARDLAVNMRILWRPDRSFLERRTRAELVRIAADSGYSEGAVIPATYKKADLVNCLDRHFAAAKAAAEPTPAQRRANAWLPEAMLFPAVDRDAPFVAGDHGDDGGGEADA